MNTITRTTARISVNKLGEYIDASARRRLTIVKDQKRPRDEKVSWYNRVYPAIDKCLAGEQSSTDLLELASQMEQPPKAPGRLGIDNLNSATAIRHFVNAFESFDFGEAVVSSGDRYPKTMSLGGTEVHMRLNAATFHPQSGIGGIKIYLSKTNSLSTKAGECVATLVHRFLADEHPGQNINVEHCLVLDVFAERWFRAPARYKQSMQEVEASLEEISGRWDKV